MAGADPLATFQANYAAYRRFPLDPALRLNLSLTLAGLLSARNVGIEDAAADRILEIATSAGGENVGVWLGRFDYLNMTGQRDEAVKVLDRIGGHARMQAGYWLARAAVSDTPEDMRANARRGLARVDPSSTLREQLERLAR